MALRIKGEVLPIRQPDVKGVQLDRRTTDLAIAFRLSDLRLGYKNPCGDEPTAWNRTPLAEMRRKPTQCATKLPALWSWIT